MAAHAAPPGDGHHLASAAERPTNEASPATRIAAHPSPASMIVRSRDWAFSLAMLASARAVCLKPVPSATTAAMACSGP